MIFSELPGWVQAIWPVLLGLGYIILGYLALDFVVAINRLINAKAKLLEAKARMTPFSKTDE